MMLKVRFVLADSQVLVIKSAIFFFIPVMFATMSIVIPVSYTHLTLPTILLV